MILITSRTNNELSIEIIENNSLKKVKLPGVGSVIKSEGFTDDILRLSKTNHIGYTQVKETSEVNNTEVIYNKGKKSKK